MTEKTVSRVEIELLAVILLLLDHSKLAPDCIINLMVWFSKRHYSEALLAQAGQIKPQVRRQLNWSK